MTFERRSLFAVNIYYGLGFNPPPAGTLLHDDSG